MPIFDFSTAMKILAPSLGYLPNRMLKPTIYEDEIEIIEPTLDELKQIGQEVLGQDLEGKPSKKEERLSMELAIKQAEVARLQEKLSNRRKKLKK